MIGLKIMKSYIGEFDFKEIKIVIKRHGSVNINVSLTKQVEIRTVDDIDGGDHGGKVTNWDSNKLIYVFRLEIKMVNFR